MFRRIIQTVFFGAGVLLTPGFAHAQSTEVAAVVNGFAISSYDLDQRTALFVASSGVQVTKETLPQIRAQVLRALEDEAIETQEADRRRITAAKPELDKMIAGIAADNKLTAEQLLATLARAGVTAATFTQQLSAQLVWQKLVVARYGPEMTTSEEQVNEALNRLRQGADKAQFLVSEIYVPVNRPDDEAGVRTSIEQIAQQIMAGAPFARIATQFSQSPSAANGGDIGWVVEGQLDEGLDRALVTMKPGQLTAPIRAEGGYYVMLLRDRREPAVEGAAANPLAAVDPNMPLPLDQLFLRLPANPDPMLKDRAMTLANNIKTNAHSCADLATIGNQLQGATYSRLGLVKPQDLDADVRGALAKSGPGEVLPPFFARDGVEVLMRCDEAVPETSAGGLPTREELRQQLFMQKLSVYARSYLQDLRRNAVVYSGGR